VTTKDGSDSGQLGDVQWTGQVEDRGRYTYRTADEQERAVLPVRIQPDIDWDTVADSLRTAQGVFASLADSLRTAADRLVSLSQAGRDGFVLDTDVPCWRVSRGQSHPGHDWDKLVPAGEDEMRVMLVHCPGHVPYMADSLHQAKCPDWADSVPHPGHAWDEADAVRSWCPGLGTRTEDSASWVLLLSCGRDTVHPGHVWTERTDAGTHQHHCPGVPLRTEDGTEVVPCYLSEGSVDTGHPGHDWHQGGKIYRCPGT
jgi:hypothetical protein